MNDYVRQRFENFVQIASTVADLPKLKAAWCQVAEQTVAGLTSTPIDQLTAVLDDLATSLAATAAPAGDVPRYVTRSRARR